MLLFKLAEKAGVGGTPEPQFRITPQRRGVEEWAGSDLLSAVTSDLWKCLSSTETSS